MLDCMQISTCTQQCPANHSHKPAKLCVRDMYPQVPRAACAVSAAGRTEAQMGWGESWSEDRLRLGSAHGQPEALRLYPGHQRSLP